MQRRLLGAFDPIERIWATVSSSRAGIMLPEVEFCKSWDFATKKCTFSTTKNVRLAWTHSTPLEFFLEEGRGRRGKKKGVELGGKGDEGDKGDR